MIYGPNSRLTRIKSLLRLFAWVRLGDESDQFIHVRLGARRRAPWYLCLPSPNIIITIEKHVFGCARSIHCWVGVTRLVGRNNDECIIIFFDAMKGAFIALKITCIPPIFFLSFFKHRNDDVNDFFLICSIWCWTFPAGHSQLYCIILLNFCWHSSNSSFHFSFHAITCKTFYCQLHCHAAIRWACSVPLCVADACRLSAHSMHISFLIVSAVRIPCSTSANGYNCDTPSSKQTENIVRAHSRTLPYLRLPSPNIDTSQQHCGPGAKMTTFQPNCEWMRVYDYYVAFYWGFILNLRV